MKAPRLDDFRRALVVAPHPDDETIGCGGLIRRLTRKGVRVTILVVTDGGASHRASKRFPRARLVRERAREVVRAAGLLGVPRGRVILLGLPDGGLDTLPPAAHRRVAGAIDRIACDLLLMPDPADAHPDHRDVARACRRRNRRRRLAYGVWPGGRLRGRALALPIGRDLAAKRLALSRHRTQFGLVDDDPAGFTIDAATRARFLRPVERYREV